MNIKLVDKLAGKPQLYEKGTSVMWTDPYISERLLELHLNPNNDMASRSRAKIELIINWILCQTDNVKLNILDLGCGPGLYAEQLAKQGHAVTGVDFSENSIRYASEQAKYKKLDIKYLHQNYLDIDFVDYFDLVILIYLDFCVLLPEERDRVLENIFKALKKNRIFICDVVNEVNIDKKIIPQSWEVQQSGFWRNSPYIALNNGYHYPDAKVFANHHIVVQENDAVDTYIFWNHYYNDEALADIMKAKGFYDIRTYKNVLPNGNDFWSGENITFCVSKKK